MNKRNFIKRLSEENNNVFVLSPRGEHIDKFDHVIRFEKVKGFSRIVNN